MAKTKWVLDPTHSEIQFKIRHLMISNVTGEFKNYSAEVETEGEDFLTAKVVFTADIDSVSTGAEQRDQHLKSEDFFDAANYPQLKFVATKYEAVDNDGSYELYGDLTIRGTTKPIKLDVEFGGIVKDPWGNTRAGFSINGKLNRKEYGLRWHAATEAGQIVASDEVKIHCAVEFIKQA
ncbi:MAG: YceI family protein [Bacteroidetes bacterium]|nr:YceI family protein [Bacteroidota bacterium]